MSLTQVSVLANTFRIKDTFRLIFSSSTFLRKKVEQISWPSRCTRVSCFKVHCTLPNALHLVVSRSWIFYLEKLRFALRSHKNLSDWPGGLALIVQLFCITLVFICFSGNWVHCCSNSLCSSPRLYLVFLRQNLQGITQILSISKKTPPRLYRNHTLKKILDSSLSILFPI